MTTDLEDLASRVEAADGAEQREMLEQAWAALFPKPNREDEPEWQGPGTLREPLFHQWKVRQLAFGRMLDAEAYESAAMTLMMEGAHWGLGHDATGPLAGWTWVRARIDGRWEEFHSPARTGLRYEEPYPATPALALTAAALMARAASIRKGQDDANAR